jgi:hypothetical protein
VERAGLVWRVGCVETRSMVCAEHDALRSPEAMAVTATALGVLGTSFMRVHNCYS